MHWVKKTLNAFIYTFAANIGNRELAKEKKIAFGSHIVGIIQQQKGKHIYSFLRFNNKIIEYKSLFLCTWTHKHRNQLSIEEKKFTSKVY